MHDYANVKVGAVVESSPARIVIEVPDLPTFERYKANMQIGKYLLVDNGNLDKLLVTISAIRAIHTESSEVDSFKFTVETQPIGTFTAEGQFTRGALSLPVPTEPAYLADDAVMDAIFRTDVDNTFSLGYLSHSPTVELRADGNKFFSKHVAVVGSTGSGKSCAVTSILHEAVGIFDGVNRYAGSVRNAHIIIFDIHSEYSAAFRLNEDQKFTVNSLGVETLHLPYWLMNAEELEGMFIETNENSSHNQVSQFRHAVVRNKIRHNPHAAKVAFDTPVYFSLEEVCTYLENLNREVIGKLDNEGKPKGADGQLIDDTAIYFTEEVKFVQASTSKDSKASNGPFHGDFDRLILRLRNKLSDPRLKFLLYPEKNGKALKTEHFPDVVRQFLGYIDRSNVSIVDVSGIPFEVLSIVISLISRIVFDFCFHYSKMKHQIGKVSDVPVMVVCEEAHNYVPRSNSAQYAASQKSIERIAKEGRKYGLTLMVVSQRPSEVSETIFSQCSNFVAMRLTNPNDQNYVRGLLPDLAMGLGDSLPNLAQGEFLAVGDAMLLPTLGKFRIPNPEPHSQSIPYLEEWRGEWREIDFNSVIERWRAR